jgi:hypothetical protein
MALLNYTTIIPPEQTIGEIQKLLSRHNVKAMMTEYDGQNVSAVSFQMEISGRLMGFKLPCNWRAVREIFNNAEHARKLKCSLENRDEQAIRTSWRVIKAWIEAQLALVEINMTTIPQVFLPYLIMKDGKTLAEKVMDDPKFLLGNGE